jgi:peptide-methionine (S)-S-oxide reductase
MNNPEISDARFREAVSAIDAGDVSTLEGLLAAHPKLVGERLEHPGDWLRSIVGDALNGYFRQPYLLWFVAENPIRNDKLPGNIAQVTHAIIQAAQREDVKSLKEQLSYTLALVCTGRVPRECGVQIELIDVLIDAGATPGQGHGALAHGNPAAAERLIERGGKLTLATAVCLERRDDITRLVREATAGDRQDALALAAMNGKAQALAMLIGLGVDVNAYHGHGTSLHHAVSSGCLDAVMALVEAGADLGMPDKVYHGTPLGWAINYRDEETRADFVKRYAEIAAYLREKEDP